MSAPLNNPGRIARLRRLSGLRATLVLDHLLIIRALILRNLKTKYRGNPLGLLVEFLQPVVICVVHYYYFCLTSRSVPGNQYLIFTIGGFTIWFCFSAAYAGTFQSFGRGAAAMRIPGVTAMHACLAKVVWAFMTFFTFAMVVAYPWTLFGAAVQPPDFWLSFETFGMAAGLGFGFGLSAQALIKTIPPLGTIIKLFQWALFITSGIYESLSTIPSVILPYIECNPLIHLAEYERAAFDPGYPTFYASLSYPAIVMVLLIFVGLSWNRLLADRAARQGVLA